MAHHIAEIDKLRTFTKRAVDADDDESLQRIYNGVRAYESAHPGFATQLPQVLRHYARHNASCATIRNDWFMYTHGPGVHLWYLWNNEYHSTSAAPSTSNRVDRRKLRNIKARYEKQREEYVRQLRTTREFLENRLQRAGCPVPEQLPLAQLAVHTMDALCCATEQQPASETTYHAYDDTTVVSGETEIVSEET